MNRLIVKNFGPLKDVDIELNKINLFIGENGSGKSVLAKLVTFVMDIFNNHAEIKNNNIKDKLLSFNINYINNSTFIQYTSSEHIIFELKNENFFQSKEMDLHETVNRVDSSIENIIENKKKAEEHKKRIESLKDEIFDDKELQKLNDLSCTVKNTLIELSNTEEKNYKLKEKILTLTSQYIPAERNLISLFNKYVTTFITADIPLPKFLLNFSSQYVRAREEIRTLDFLNVKYKFENDQERIFYNDKDYLLLEQSSSGIQSALPLYLAVKYFAKKHKSIIIEEPEQNLFPKAQAKTIQYIIEQVSNENDLFMMTHSPYVLSTINNLIYAHVVADLGDKEKAQVQELVNENQWINPDDFSAYYLENGVARSIKSDMGLISDNEIDDISEEMGAEFDELLEIYRESKNG